MQSATNELESQVKAAKSASKKLAYLSSSIKSKALHAIADGLVANESDILAANKLDYFNGEESGLSAAILDRLLLSSERIRAISDDVRAVAILPDPVGETFDTRTLPNGLQVGKRRVPLGLVAAIYESRPNVTVDISVLCLKSGNAVILRGGKEAVHSNSALAKVIQDASCQAGVPGGAVQFVESTDRALVGHLLKMRDVIDLVIPRGGAKLINYVAENAAMAVVTGGIGVCHTYVDCSADLAKAVAIAYNAKVQRPTVCNALDTLLVHAEVAEHYLPLVAEEWGKAGVEMRCDQRSLKILKLLPGVKAISATEQDWGREFLALVAAVKVVESVGEALEHIERYGSGHSEAIVTEDHSVAMRFLNEADAACVYVNASTRFTDGGQFGLGAEVGISTQKFHARGPMGLKELTSYKWIILGTGQVRS
ncbi:glutamate-5-semialdehyde dehydrogenase [Chloroflexota bacterium]